VVGVAGYRGCHRRLARCPARDDPDRLREPLEQIGGSSLEPRRHHHDAARPFASPDLFTTVFSALESGADGAVPTVPVADTVKRIRDGEIVATEPREELRLAQTPQAFRVGPFLDAHERAAAAGVDLSDDAAVLEWAGYRVVSVAGEPGNVKITTGHDLEAALERRGSHA
jgi:2-C-methyl-D-erythritol 4-phosphate cytidylyltransferase/2-C-methyl-D-erythritol 2,4-cyclodiphosphate synthase